MAFVYLVAIFTGILFGITESLNKNITDHKYSSLAYSFIQNFSSFIIYLIPFILFFQLPDLGISYVYLACTIILFLVGNVLLIKAYKTHDISIVSILSKSNLIITFLAGVLLLSDNVTALKIVGIISIVIGIVIIFYEKNKISFSTGAIIALLSGSLWGIGTYFRKLTLFSFSPISLAFLSQLVMSIVLFMFPSTRQDAPKIFRKYKTKIIASRITAAIGIFLVNWTVQNGKISIVNTNIETFSLLSSVFIGIFILNEKNRIMNKLVGSVLCTTGIVLLNFF